jgi:hypothetical protein
MRCPMPDWMKSTALFVIIMICWDIIRLFLQGMVNRWMMRKDFEKLEDAIEEEGGESDDG